MKLSKKKEEELYSAVYEEINTARVQIWKMRFQEKISIGEIDDIISDLLIDAPQAALNCFTQTRQHMKTIRRVEIVPVFVEYIPDTLKQDIVYISLEYGTSVHLCLCGCGNLSVTPLNKDGWNLTEKDGLVSFTPSVLNTNCPNRTHYVITNNIANIIP